MAKKNKTSNAKRTVVSRSNKRANTAKQARNTNGGNIKTNYQYIPIDSGMKQYENAISNLNNNISKWLNSAASYSRAAQTEQEYQNKWNADQAQINRDWQANMSATAHQREVADLKAAGLNPILSVNAGAPIGSGAQASSNDAIVGVMGNMASTMMASAKDMVEALASSQAHYMDIAANMNSALGAAKYTADTSYNASTYGSDASSAATRYAAKTSYSASVYGTKMAYKSAIYGAKASYNASIYGSRASYNASVFAAKLAANTQISCNRATNIMNQNIAKINAISSQTVAQIAGRYNIDATKLNNWVQNKSAELAYKASIYGSDTSKYNVGKQVDASYLNTDAGVIGNIVSSLIGKIPGLESVSSAINPRNKKTSAKRGKR